MSDAKYSLKLIHLYPEEMNIYGDMGNIITLERRCTWRGINFEKQSLGFSDDITKSKGDIYFMGGGQDNDMYAVFEDLRNNKQEFIKKEVEGNKVFLLICGGFQLFGNEFIDAGAREIKGLEILPVTTKAPGSALEERCLGNLITKISPKIKDEIRNYYKGEFSDYIVGFENHSGQTYFESDRVKPIGKTIVGFGNNAKEGIEGARYKNIFGSYTHGSLLPKNPHLADLIIGLALENKYKKSIKLEPLDDTAEWQAHKRVIELYGGSALS